MKNYTVFVGVVLLLASLIILGLGYLRYHDFRAYHNAIAKEATEGLAFEVSRFVEERKRLVRLFAEEYVQLLQAIQRGESLLENEQRLKREVGRFFPGHFAVTVTDEEGNPYLEDFDGLVGELCRADLREFARRGEHHPRVHPHHEVYHFDIMAPLGPGPERGTLFINFEADMLASAIATAQVPGHQLMLVYPRGDDLIEVTSSGSRIQLTRNDFRLTAEERGRILAAKDSEGTSWRAIDLYEPALFQEHLQRLLLQGAVLFAAFAAVCALMWLVIRRAEALRATAERHKSEFLSVVSHELRTPLTAISGSLELMINGVTGSLSNKTQELALLAQRNCERLILLVNDLLDFQKMASGRLSYQMRDLEIGRLITRAVAGCRDYAARFGSEINMVNTASAIYVHGDAHRLTQVLDNLLSNAAKYGAASDTIEVGVSADDKHVSIRVSDHGPGIPEEFRSRLFVPFSQADSSDSRRVAGTGLGLNIAKRIIEDHGGRLDYQSEPGQGTTFEFVLPRVATAGASRGRVCDTE